MAARLTYGLIFRYKRMVRLVMYIDIVLDDEELETITNGGFIKIAAPDGICITISKDLEENEED